MSTFYNAWENWNTWFNFHPSSNPNNRIIEKVCNCRFISKVDFNTFVECNFTSPAQWLINIIFYLPCNEIFLLTSFCTMNILILDTLTHSLATHSVENSTSWKYQDNVTILSLLTLWSLVRTCVCVQIDTEDLEKIARGLLSFIECGPRWEWGGRGPGKQWTGNCLASHHWEWKPNCWVTSHK